MPAPATLSFPLALARWRASAESPPTAPAWNAELERIAWRYHVIGGWVAAVLNLCFILNDVALVPGLAARFAVLRIGVSAVILGLLLLRRHWRWGPYAFMFVPYMLISLENATMWAQLPVDLFQLHALAYAVLFVGASMVLVWPLRWSLAIAVSTIAANCWSLMDSPYMTPAEVMVNGGTLLAAVIIIATLLGQTRYLRTRREVILRGQLKARTVEAHQQREVIEAAHRDLQASIRYSQRIQQAVMPDPQVLRGRVKEHFILHRPKDIVSGDFHWCTQAGPYTVIAAADCTGHGVPGALMSILGSTLLRSIVNEGNGMHPASILERLRGGIIAALGRQSGEGPSDGMDIALCVIDHEGGTLSFAGAYNPLYHVHDGQLIELAGDRMPIGPHMAPTSPFTEHSITLTEGDMFYMCSDGFQDQFGGRGDRKFGRTRLKDLLRSIHTDSCRDQERKLLHALELWQQDRPALDDVLVIGFRV
jgi:serine phosphatase RsbU (regulator of sigma subunit)